MTITQHTPRSTTSILLFFLRNYFINFISMQSLSTWLHGWIQGQVDDRSHWFYYISQFIRQGRGDDFNISWEHTKSLYSACSMFNHSSEPTRFYSNSNIGGCISVFTRIGLKAGSKLTVCYHPDEDVFRKNWGVLLIAAGSGNVRRTMWPHCVAEESVGRHIFLLHWRDDATCAQNDTHAAILEGKFVHQIIRRELMNEFAMSKG